MVRNRRFAAFSTMCVVAAACAAFDAPPGFAQFVQQGPKLVGSGAAANAKQGDSVSLSADGNTAIVGGPSDNSGFGAAWIWTRSGGAWTVARRLSGSNLVGFAGQGRSVSISADGNTALVGGLELCLGAPVEAAYLVANGTLRPLPVGSIVAGSVFAWMPPAGYLGSYRFAFLRG